MGMLASIGHHTGVASFFGFKFSGFIAWWMWRSVYLAKLPRLVKKLRVMIAWTLDLLFGRDIEQMITLRDVEELTERWARIRANETTQRRVAMDTTIVTALAGIVGSLCGGTASFATAWLTQKTRAKHDGVRAELRKREALYGEFIDECSACARFVREHSRQIGKVVVDLRFAQPHPALRVRRRSFRSGTRPGVDHRTVLLAQSLARTVACPGARWRQVGSASLIRGSVSGGSQIDAHGVLVVRRRLETINDQSAPKLYETISSEALVSETIPSEPWPKMQNRIKHYLMKSFPIVSIGFVLPLAELVKENQELPNDCIALVE